MGRRMRTLLSPSPGHSARVFTFLEVPLVAILAGIFWHIPVCRTKASARRQTRARPRARLDGRKAVMPSSAGMTVIEIMVAIAILGVISLIMYYFFSTQYRINATSERVEEQREVAMYAMKALVREIRMAGYGNTTSEDITQAGAGAITFKVYNDSTSSLETVKYSYSGTALLERTGTTLSTMFPNLRVQSLGFSYYDGSGGEISAGLTSASVRATIRKVRVQLEAQAATKASAVGTNPLITLRSEVKLRNIQ